MLKLLGKEAGLKREQTTWRLIADIAATPPRLPALQGGLPIAPVAKEVGPPFNLLCPPLGIVSVKRKI